MACVEWDLSLVKSLLGHVIHLNYSEIENRRKKQVLPFEFKLNKLPVRFWHYYYEEIYIESLKKKKKGFNVHY